MNESYRLADQLHRACFGGAWHGPSLKEVLDGIGAGQAAAHPIHSAHSIWELLLHVDAWTREALDTIGGKPYETLKGERDWPPVSDNSDEAWLNARNMLNQACESLEAAIREFPPEKLGEGDRSMYYLLHGIVQHNLYHAGQMALLKRAMQL